jgi:hypothetical protein
LYKLQKYILTTIFLLQVNIVNSGPWFSTDQKFIQQEIEKLRHCGVSLPPISAYPLNISTVYNALKNTNQLNLSLGCKQTLNFFKYTIEKNLYNKKNIIGLQTQRPDIYFQDFGRRLASDPHVYLSSSKSNHSYAYNLSLQFFSDDIRFDESYLSYYFDNHVLTLGRSSKWWSPSFNSSLILSNSARPSPGISISNYQPKPISSKYLSFLGPVSYEIFINKLEKDRHIQNPYLFGNRLSIQPHHRLKISLFRTAQFGGEGRKLNSKIFFDMLIGKDNYHSYDTNPENEPGNQLGGLDFNYLLLKDKNLSLYGQIVGEDEAGYLPSKTFYSLGMSYSWDKLNLKKINFEHIDTGSRQINTTYNHSIYKNGYRYHGRPIGSVFDADSKISSFNYQQVLKNNTYFEFAVVKASLNYNKSNNFFINGLSDELTITKANVNQKIFKSVYINFTVQYNDFISTNTYDNLTTHVAIEYRW